MDVGQGARGTLPARAAAADTGACCIAGGRAGRPEVIAPAKAAAAASEAVSRSREQLVIWMLRTQSSALPLSLPACGTPALISIPTTVPADACVSPTPEVQSSHSEKYIVIDLHE